MPYIDYQYYTDEFKGVSLDEGTFSSLVSRASNAVDQMTNYRIVSLGFDNLHDSIKQRIRMAVASQVEYVHINGGIVGTQSDDLTSVSINSFSYSKAPSSSAGGRPVVGPTALNYLKGTGLLYSGVTTIG